MSFQFSFTFKILIRNKKKPCYFNSHYSMLLHVDVKKKLKYTISRQNALFNTSIIFSFNFTLQDADDSHLIDTHVDESFRSMKFNITAGVISRSKMVSFERILWRVSKGKYFVTRNLLCISALFFWEIVVRHKYDFIFFVLASFSRQCVRPVRRHGRRFGRPCDPRGHDQVRVHGLLPGRGFEDKGQEDLRRLPRHHLPVPGESQREAGDHVRCQHKVRSGRTVNF